MVRNKQSHNWADGRKGKGKAGARSVLGRSIQSTNMYGALGNGGNMYNGEMNAHIAERFHGSSAHHNRYPDPERVPLSLPARTNKDIEEYYSDAAKPVANAGAWLNNTEIPQPSEILPDPSTLSFPLGPEIVKIDDELRPNKVEGAYDSKEDYLRTQYDLLKEDAIRPLRKAVEEVRRDPLRDESDYTSNIGIYEPVYLTGVVFSPRGLAARVAFSLGRVKKYVRWKQSKRLITGTLTTCIMATVAARPLSALEANPPEIDLFFARTQDFQIDPMKKWIMVESRSSFFEASRHTLLSLQHMMRESFPLSEHIVKIKKDVEPPKYVLDNPYIDMSSLNVNILQSWPEGDSHSLDNSQSTALKRILTNKLAIVQGPPGTGKTYVSVVALKILLANLRKEDPPIIVTCQTNHALDQILRHIAEFEPNFIRLGGRSKDTDKIKKRTLFEVRNSYSQPRIPGSRKHQAIVAMKQLTTKMQILLAPLSMGNGCLDHRLLVKLRLITEEQARSLELENSMAMGVAQDAPGIQIEQWLGKFLVPCRRPIQPDDFGMAYEDEDFDEVDQLEELEAEAVARDDDDIDALRGPVTSLCDNQTGKGGLYWSDDQVHNLLQRTPDLINIPPSDRGAIYQYFQRHTKRIILEDFRELARQYEVFVQHRKIGQWEQDQALLAQQRLIGLTTTGLSKYRPLIASLRPRIVLVEEAAETLEAPVTAACVPSLEHLILVGDHQQLRPHCQVHEFEDEPYYFNLSLFERMAVNNIEIDCLTRQRRMIPEIRRLLAPIYDTTLQDHTSVTDVSNRPPVEGMGGNNSYFFHHSWPESRDSNMSCQNELEAAMIVGFFDYLVVNGVDSKKITVLTFYNGQRALLLKKLRQHQNLRGHFLNVVTVDSYQGEENDIVLLSLVRSNRKGGIGFLSVDNRVCVALSRAKRGFYIFGNAEKLAIESNTWADVVWTMYGKSKTHEIPTTGQPRRVGFRFPIECTNHGHKMWLQSPEDWDYINGGCDENCRCMLPCGHTCMLRCHPFPNDMINCTQMCNKVIPSCGHKCQGMCCDPCKCDICERRSGGKKAMLKAPIKAKAYNQEPQNFSTLSSSLEHWKTYAQGGVREDDAKMFQKAKEDSAKLYELASRSPQAEHSPSQPQLQTKTKSSTAKLIEISPKKKKVSPPAQSQTMDLLGDLVGGTGEQEASPSKTRVKYEETFTPFAPSSSTLTVRNKGKGKEKEMENKSVNHVAFGAGKNKGPAAIPNLMD
ncbi:P-loop containing nucleoside triphosphate hydrolase protein [Byssothecium circinans]|uniref:P-loop containing nucleoside triphosphate hydrolase protein n=1 Tax=Byssothecium circinans TaxID=147558 RepID=A0A6A5TFG1_9PLEO|nr:P-loop containing nucleoside triphosphate hydrolase protein [Byssothecium circinans]